MGGIGDILCVCWEGNFKRVGKFICSESDAQGKIYGGKPKLA